MFGSSICIVECGAPIAYHVKLVVCAYKVELRFPLSLPSVLERTGLVRSCCKKSVLLVSSYQFELLSFCQWHKGWIFGCGYQCPDIGNSEASLPLFSSISELCHLLIIIPDESSLSGSLFLYLLNEGHTS